MVLGCLSELEAEGPEDELGSGGVPLADLDVQQLQTQREHGEHRKETTHIEHIFLFSEHLVLVRDPHAQALLECANDLAELLDRARVHDLCGGAYEPHGRDFVPWFGWVRAHEHVIHEPEERGRIGWDVDMATVWGQEGGVAQRAE